MQMIQGGGIDMIQKFTYGAPLRTDAVVNEIPAEVYVYLPHVRR